MQTREVAGWCYGACAGGISRPHGRGGAACGPRRRPGGQGPRECGSRALLRNATYRVSRAGGDGAVMAMTRRGVVLLSWAGVGGGAGGGACWKGSDAATSCSDMQTGEVAGWRYGACADGFPWPQRRGGAAGEPRRRPGGQGPRECGGRVLLCVGPRRVSRASVGSAVMAMRRGVVLLSWAGVGGGAGGSGSR